MLKLVCLNFCCVASGAVLLAVKSFFFLIKEQVFVEVIVGVDAKCRIRYVSRYRVANTIRIANTLFLRG